MTGVSESFVIWSLWNRVVKLMAKCAECPQGKEVGGEAQGVPKAIYEDSTGKIGNCVNTVNTLISSEMLIGLT